MVHIGYTLELLTMGYVQEIEVKPNTLDVTGMTKVEILKLLENGIEYVAQVIYNIEQEQLDESCVIDYSGNRVSRGFAFFYVRDHMNNHRAKT